MPGRARVMGVVFVHEAWIAGELASKRYAVSAGQEVMDVCFVMIRNGSMKLCYLGAFFCVYSAMSLRNAALQVHLGIQKLARED